MADTRPAETSASIRSRVIKARAIQQLRFQGEKGIYCNAQMNSRLLHKYAWPDEAGLAKLKDRMTRLNMSARAFDRILRVARTIADLEYATTLPSEAITASPASAGHSASSDSAGHSASSASAGHSASSDSDTAYSKRLEEAVSAPVLSHHIAEAIGYRALDRESYGKVF